MIMTWIYRAIVLLFLVFVTMDFWKEGKVSKKITACMVMVPLALRLLMIK